MQIQDRIMQFCFSKKSLDDLEKKFDECIDNSKLLIDQDSTCTLNGAQTINVINFLDQSFFVEVYGFIDKYLQNYYSNQLLFYQYYINHIHFIKYEKDGYQKDHKHDAFEDHSFILYLNDSNAATQIWQGNKILKVSSKRGIVVLFNSSLWHGSTKCDSIRKVVVGSIRFRHKIWKD